MKLREMNLEKEKNYPNNNNHQEAIIFNKKFSFKEHDYDSDKFRNLAIFNGSNKTFGRISGTNSTPLFGGPSGDNKKIFKFDSSSIQSFKPFSLGDTGQSKNHRSQLLDKSSPPLPFPEIPENTHKKINKGKFIEAYSEKYDSNGSTKENINKKTLQKRSAFSEGNKENFHNIQKNYELNTNSPEFKKNKSRNINYKKTISKEKKDFLKIKTKGSLHSSISKLESIYQEYIKLMDHQNKIESLEDLSIIENQNTNELDPKKIFGVHESKDGNEKEFIQLIDSKETFPKLGFYNGDSKETFPRFSNSFSQIRGTDESKDMNNINFINHMSIDNPKTVLNDSLFRKSKEFPKTLKRDISKPYTKLLVPVRVLLKIVYFT